MRNAKQLMKRLEDLQNNKRGAITFQDVPSTALMLVFIAVIFVAGYLVLAGLGSATTDASALAAIGNLTLSLDNIVTYAPTWGVLVGVSIVVSIVILAFGFIVGRNRGVF